MKTVDIIALQLLGCRVCLRRKRAGTSLSEGDCLLSLAGGNNAA